MPFFSPMIMHFMILYLIFLDGWCSVGTSNFKEQFTVICIISWNYNFSNSHSHAIYIFFFQLSQVLIPYFTLSKINVCIWISISLQLRMVFHFRYIFCKYSTLLRSSKYFILKSSFHIDRISQPHFENYVIIYYFIFTILYN